MTGPAAVVITAPMTLVVGALAVAAIIGVVDLLRLPGWAWRKASEPKYLYLALVILIPVVGLAVYLFSARPEVAAVTATGRAAALPFERLGDRDELAPEHGRAFLDHALHTSIGSFGERRATRPIMTSDFRSTQPSPARSFDDYDLVAAGGTPGTTPVAVPTIVVDPAAADEHRIHIPGGMGSPYRPRQRTSLDGVHNLHAVAAQILEAAPGPNGPPEPIGARSRALSSVMPAPSAGAAASMAAPMAGPMAAGSMPLLSAPLPVTDTPPPTRPAGPSPRPVTPSIGGTSAVAPGWLPDPTGRHRHRYWDGNAWAQNVDDGGIRSRDPVTD